jgi:hypothetical protein
MAPRKIRLAEENELVEVDEEDDDEESIDIEMPPSLLRKIVVLQKLHTDTEDIDVEYKKARFVTLKLISIFLETSIKILHLILLIS